MLVNRSQTITKLTKTWNTVESPNIEPLLKDLGITNDALRRLFTLSSIYSINARGAEQMPKTNKSNQPRGTGHYLSPGGGGGRGWTPEDLGLNKVKFSLSPFECYLTEIIPPNNIWWLSRFPPTPCGLPFESFQRFWWSPFLGSQLRLIPPFVLHKIKCPASPPGDK